MPSTFIMSSWLMSKHRSTVKVCAKCATELPLAGSVVDLLVTVVPSIWLHSPSSVVQPAGSSTRYLAIHRSLLKFFNNAHDYIHDKKGNSRLREL